MGATPQRGPADTSPGESSENGREKKEQFSHQLTSFFRLPFPPLALTVIKITSFCSSLNIPTLYKGLCYTRVTVGPSVCTEISLQVPPS